MPDDTRGKAHLRFLSLWLVNRLVVARNRFRRFVWDTLLPANASQRTAQACKFRAVEQPFRNSIIQTGDSLLDARLTADAQEPHYAWAYHYRGDILIEPRYGYAVERRFRLLDESMPFIEWSRDPRWWHLIAFPSVTSIAAARTGARRRRRFGAVISLRFYWETNYFHLLNDILPRLHMARQFGVPPDVPVVVGSKLAEKPYFREICQGGTLDGRPVIEQDDDFIEFESGYFFRPPSDYDGVAFVATLLGAPAHPSGARRLFVNRRAGSRRSVINFEELRPALEEFGFDVVDTEGWSLADQVALFSSAEHVVGIHGAGLANMIFRRGARCSVLEIFPPDEALGFYAQLCCRLGFAYDAIRGYSTGSDVDRWAPFLVDPLRFRDRLASFVASDLPAAMSG